MRFTIACAKHLYCHEPPAQAAVQTKKSTLTYPEWEIKITTLAQLMALVDEVGCRLVIDETRILVYNDYIE